MDDSILIASVCLVVDIAIVATHRVRPNQRGIRFRLGKPLPVLGPGIYFMVPVIERILSVDVDNRVIRIPNVYIVDMNGKTGRISAEFVIRVTDPLKAVLMGEVNFVVTRGATEFIKQFIRERSLDRFGASLSELDRELSSNVIHAGECLGFSLMRHKVFDLKVAVSARET